MQESVVVDFFSLSLEGLKLRYRSPHGKTTLTFDAFSTCVVLHELDIIEGFDTDGNEPIILHTEQELYGWTEWCHFVQRFTLSRADALRIAEHHHLHNALTSQPIKDASKEAAKQAPLLTSKVLPTSRNYNFYRIYETKIKGK